MRARIIGAFALGCAVGALCLSVVLWRAGALRETVQAAWRKPLSTPPVTLPDFANVPKPPPPIEPPPFPMPPNAGEADRAIPEITGEPRLAMPIDGVDPKRLGDNFRERRDGRRHEALDIFAARGTPVKAVAEGNVVKLFSSKQGGLTVYQFDDSQAWCFYYAHLDRYAPGLAEGTLLRKGDVLGYVGSTGDASPSSPHLHLAVFKLGPEKKWWEGTPVDPLPLLKP